MTTCHVLESNTRVSRGVVAYAGSVREVMLRYGEIVEQSFVKDLLWLLGVGFLP